MAKHEAAVSLLPFPPFSLSLFFAFPLRSTVCFPVYSLAALICRANVAFSFFFFSLLSILFSEASALSLCCFLFRVR